MRKKTLLSIVALAALLAVPQGVKADAETDCTINDNEMTIWNFEDADTWKSTFDGTTTAGTYNVNKLQIVAVAGQSFTYDNTNKRLQMPQANPTEAGSYLHFNIAKSGSSTLNGYIVVIGKGNHKSAGLNVAAGGTVTETGTFTEFAKTNGKYFVWTSSKIGVNDTKKVYIKGNNSAIAVITKIAWIPEEQLDKTITLGTAGFSTTCLLADAKLPTGLKAYALTTEPTSSLSGTSFTLVADGDASEDADKIAPALTGLLLVGTGDTEYALTYPTNKGTFNVGACGDVNAYKNVNYLKGTTESTALPDDAWGLKKNTNTFCKFADSQTLAAKKAYFVSTLGAVTSTREFSITFDNETTGIGALLPNREVKSQGIFDLQGRRVSHPVKGLYIVNGKKVVIK